MSEWPKVIKTYLHSSKDDNYYEGGKIGLSEEAMETFRGNCYEVEITQIVYENGTAYTTHIEGVELPKKIKAT